MAAKKSRSKPGLKPTPSKSDFIRQQPPTMSATEVVAKAKAAGIKFAPMLVYKVRGRAKSKKAGTKTAPAMVATTHNAISTKPAKSKAAFVRSLRWTQLFGPKRPVVKVEPAFLSYSVSYI
jgi:hypothetical protein